MELGVVRARSPHPGLVRPSRGHEETERVALNLIVVTRGPRVARVQTSHADRPELHARMCCAAFPGSC